MAFVALFDLYFVLLWRTSTEEGGGRQIVMERRRWGEASCWLSLSLVLSVLECLSVILVLEMLDMHSNERIVNLERCSWRL